MQLLTVEVDVDSTTNTANNTAAAVCAGLRGCIRPHLHHTGPVGTSPCWDPQLQVRKVKASNPCGPIVMLNPDSHNYKMYIPKYCIVIN